MSRLTWIFALLALALLSGHFGYLHLAAAPVASGGRSNERPELIWLQRELDLTPSQLTAVHALHEEYWPRVASLRTQLEAQRRSGHADTPDAAVAMEDQCKNCTVSFIQQMTAVLTPAQRQKYLNLVGSCLPPATRSAGMHVEQSPGR